MSGSVDAGTYDGPLGFKFQSAEKEAFFTYKSYGSVPVSEHVPTRNIHNSKIDLPYFEKMMCRFKVNFDWLLSPSKAVEYLRDLHVAATGNRILALLLINDYYFTNNSVQVNIDSGLTTIFGFEGAGSYLDPWVYAKNETPYHSIGRYGAMMAVVKGKSVKYITINASTLPDGHNSIVDEGVYKYESGMHQSTYPAMRPSPEGEDWSSSKGGVKETVQYANIHAAGLGKGSNWSTACQTIYAPDYSAFGKAVGFLQKNAPDAESFSDVKTGLTVSDLVEGIEALYVLDRKLMPSAQKKLFKLDLW